MPPTHVDFPVDGHVHFHSLGRVAPTLDAAVTNFCARVGRPEGVLGALLLAQASGEKVFEALQRERSAGAWTVRPAHEEPETLLASRDGVTIAVVCGRQVRAGDGLEVLALGTCRSYPDGSPFEDTVRSVLASGALTVVPWGFGKWRGERGRRVEKTFETQGPGDLFVGDSGGRLSLAGLPHLIRTARANGFRVLPGTDPFPIAGGHRGVGRFGFLAQIAPGTSAPWRELRSWLVSRQESPPAYGRAAGPLKFLVSQVGIQIHNRWPGRRDA